VFRTAAASWFGLTPARWRWRWWRRTRPFAGGLLLTSAGIELLLIPLSGIFLHGATGLAGFGGVAGAYSVQVAVLETACGVVVWVKPAHRISFGIAGVVLAIISLITSTLGGFFLGMLLGITGGSLAFAWTPAALETGPAQLAQPADLLQPGRSNGGKHRGGSPVQSRFLAVALAGVLVFPPPSPASAVSRGPQVTAAAPAEITARSATMRGVAYQGLSTARTSSGRITVMKFTLSSLALSDFVLTLPRQAQVLCGSSAVFSGGVTVYAPAVSGDLLGIRLALSPGDVASTLLHLLQPLTPLIPVTITDLTAGQILLEAGNMQATDVTIRIAPAHDR
jgi:hypothetical protein